MGEYSLQTAHLINRPNKQNAVVDRLQTRGAVVRPRRPRHGTLLGRRRLYGLQDEGNDRVWGTLVFDELTA
jgi:hypothetical protein